MKFTSDHVSPSGWRQCHAIDREDANPSAAINVKSSNGSLGKYKDLGGGKSSKAISFFELAASLGRFADFREARAFYAERVAGKLPGPGNATGSKAPTAAVADPADKLKFDSCLSAFAPYFIAAKQGVTEQSLIDVGARSAMMGRHRVLAFSIFDEALDFDKPVGWVAANYNGGPLPTYEKAVDDATGEEKWIVKRQVKYQIVPGSKPGLVGRHALERIKRHDPIELVWKPEGISDLLALQAIIPEHLRDSHLVVTNSCGTDEIPKPVASLLAMYNVAVLHDADVPGQTGDAQRSTNDGGAARWAFTLAAQAAPNCTVRNVQLGYEIESKHGKDLRDYLAEGHSYGDLLKLWEQTPPVVVGRTESGEIDYSQVEYPLQDLMLKKLQLEVLYEEEDLRVRVFSTHLRKSTTIRTERLRKETIIQICGPPAKVHIADKPGDGDDECWSVADIRDAICLIASKRREKGDERGVGVWQGEDGDGNHNQSIVVANRSSAAVWGPDEILRKADSPRTDGLLLDFGARHTDWFDFDTLNNNLNLAADPRWSEDVLGECESLFDRWLWKHQGVAPGLLTGLALATWVQTIWSWRPLVAIIGESNSGKSFLFEALGGGPLVPRGLFGNLAFKQAKSTEAGIRQGVGKTALVVLCDEFEQSKDRPAVLKMMRAGTRGDDFARGTSDQKGKTFKVRHLCWMAAFESGLDEQADLNRFIVLELLPAAAGKHGRLQLPTSQELQALGQKLLAIAVRSALRAKELASQLRSTQIEGVGSRAIENYAVPAAMIAAAVNLPDDEASELLARMLLGVERTEQSVKDQDELLRAILAASVNCGVKGGWLSVAQILESGSHFYEHSQTLEAMGVKRAESDGLFIASKIVAQKLLKGTRWEGQRINELLRRLQGASDANRRIAGAQHRGVVVPGATLAEFIKDDPLR